MVLCVWLFVCYHKLFPLKGSSLHLTNISTEHITGCHVASSSSKSRTSNHVHGLHLSEELEYFDGAAYLHRKTHAYSSFTLSCGYVSAITLIYGCFGFVLTLQHRCTGVYPAVKFMGLACHCLAMFWFGGVFVCLDAVVLDDRRGEMLTRIQSVSDYVATWWDAWQIEQLILKKVACLISQRNTWRYTWDSRLIKPTMCMQ